MKLRLIVGLLPCCLVSQGQSVNTQMGARVAGMGNASSTLTDGFSLFNNPGTIGMIKEASASFAHEVIPLVPGSNRTACGFTVPTSFAVAAVGIFRFGDELYNEQVISTTVSNTLGITSLGLRANYVQYYAEGFGKKTAVRIDFGGLVRITPQVSIGAYIINLTQAKNSQDEYLPVSLVAGLSFKASRQILLTTEIEKDILYKPTWRTGVECTVHKKISARTGFNLNPAAAFFGLGLHTTRVKFDFATKLGGPFGTTHQASASYHFIRNAKK